MNPKKTMRHFYCKDVLWNAFEEMANDFSVSVDYLINEAMRQYAKNKGYAVVARSTSTPSGYPVTKEVNRIKSSKQPPPIPQKLSQKRKTSNSGSFDFAGYDLFDEPDEKSAPLTLYIIYNGEKIPIDKDQFIIGRYSKLCNLVIKDTNVSRKHAIITKEKGNYYIKDLGSTNGIEYNGMYIDNKRIDEGDIFSICDHELRFTFK